MGLASYGRRGGYYHWNPPLDAPVAHNEGNALIHGLLAAVQGCDFHWYMDTIEKPPNKFMVIVVHLWYRNDLVFLFDTCRPQFGGQTIVVFTSFAFISFGVYHIAIAIFLKHFGKRVKKENAD